VTARAHREPPNRGPADRWPPWFAAAGFLLAFSAVLVLVLIARGIALAVSPGTDADAPGVVLASTVLQDLAFVLVPFYLARLVGPAGPAALGLRPVDARTGLAWTIGVGAAFYALLALYTALLRPDGEQDVLDSLGADEGTGLLVASGIVVIVLAPLAEELLFRGFMYRSLRNRLGSWSAACVIGAVFGAIHYSGPDTLELLPPLAALGVAFCVLYERTGSLYPAIALHAVNNALAFAVTADGAAAPTVAFACLAVALGACVIPSRRSASRRLTTRGRTD
jgi:uncharacterized protein